MADLPAGTARIVLTVSGSDRPGLTNELAEAVLAAGGNWQEGHLSRLGGLYVGSVLVELAPEAVETLKDRVRAIGDSGLQVVATPAGDGPAGKQASLMFELLGQDRPGIIRQVTSILASLGREYRNAVERRANRRMGRRTSVLGQGGRDFAGRCVGRGCSGRAGGYFQ